MALGDEKYILLTTYRRHGTPASTPVSAVPLVDGKFGFWTSSGPTAHIVEGERVPYGDRGVVVTPAH